MNFSDAVLANEPAIRLASFFGIFAVMAIWEALAPRRRSDYGRLRRWPANLGILVINALLVRLVFPMAAVGFALTATTHGIGLFNVMAMPDWLAVIVSVAMLDMIIYFQHRLFHAVPLLWRLHRMHHADLHFDVTTGGRFHPVEIILSMLIKAVAVFALGAPAAGVLLFEALLNGSSLFNHGNVRLPAAIDRALRLVLVTPDMHRVHHSVRREETDSNFGFAMAWWDRLFATYRAQPADGQDGMTIGLPYLRASAELGLWHLLTQPFRSVDR